MVTSLQHSRASSATLSLIGFVLGTFLAAAIGGLANAGGIGGWYEELNKPVWNPPNWLFGPVWTVLYLCMAVAAWRVFLRTRHGMNSPEMWLYGIQLALNGLWSVIFFGLRMPGMAFGEILLLLGAVSLTTFAFRKRDPGAGRLMIPYLLWVSFAAVLNFAIWQMN